MTKVICVNFLVIYHPLKEYLVKKRYISMWKEGIDIHIEIEDRKELGGERRHPVDIRWTICK